MFFKNLLTGIVWEVTHSDHIKRCQKDKNYEEVKESKPKKVKQSPKKEGE